MTLKELFNIQPNYLISLHWGNLSPLSDISGLSHDSRIIKPNSVYVAICGHGKDGHNFIESALKKGASVLVVQNPSSVPSSFKGAVLTVTDTRWVLNDMAKKYFQNPGEQMTSLAVTGTNGKTSSSCLLEFLLNESRKDCALIGTIDCHFKKKVWPTGLTTPDPITLQKRLRDFLTLGAKSFVLEASSHALSQKRINQGFDVCLFTNLSRDHLDYHKNMEEYFLAKAKLFSDKMIKKNRETFAVINGDDPYGLRLKTLCHSRKVFLFGQNESHDFSFKIKNQSLDGTEIHLSLPGGKDLEFFSPLLGEHNAYNVVASLTCLSVLGISLQHPVKRLSEFKGIPGRLESYRSSSGVYAFIDYAHSPDALEKVLSFLTFYKKQNQKLITVFGCGGDRDPGKRPLMGQVAKKHSDHLVITSDNPRTENPYDIIKGILGGLTSGDPILDIELTLETGSADNKNDWITETDKKDSLNSCFSIKAFGENSGKPNRVVVEPDRALAIKKAVEMSRPGDIILVAGKGHESYQILGDKKLPFRDNMKLMEAFNPK